MSDMPCQNPNCKSYGKPHPNCECVQEFAEGGEVPAGFKLDPEEQVDPNQQSVPEGFSLDPEKSDEEQVPEGFTLDDADKYTSPMQQAATVGEGLVQGLPFVGPAATEAEIKLGVPAEDIKGRADANPYEHGLSKAATAIGSIFMPMGAAARAASLGKTALVGFLSNAARQGSDETTNWILGDSDPESPVAARIANIGMAGLLGSAGNILSKGASIGLGKLAEKAIGPKIEPVLEGFHAAASGTDLSHLAEVVNPTEKLAGAALYKALTSHFIPYETGALGSMAGATHGYEEEGLYGAGKGAIVGGISGALSGLLGRPLINKITSIVGKNMVAPLVGKILSSGTAEGIGDVISHATDVKRGFDTTNKMVDALFKTGSTGGQQLLDDIVTHDNRDATKNYILDDHPNVIPQMMQEQKQATQPQGFAEGGEVKSQPAKPSNKPPLLREDDGLAMHYPAQNMLLVAAKNRVANYLHTLKPQQSMGQLPFDDAHDTKDQERSFHQAIDIANHPLSMLKHIKDGTLEPDQVRHFQSMYPEVNTLLQKKLTQKIMEAQIDGTKPSYKVRQGMSLFMGTPLSSELTPQNIQAAQAVFQNKTAQPQQQAPVTKNKKDTSTLSKVDNAYLTPSQARQEKASQG